MYASQAQLACMRGEPSKARAAAVNGRHCFSQLEISDPIRSNYWKQRQRELQTFMKFEA